VDKRNRHAAFSNCRCNPFHGTQPYVTARKNAGRAGLEKVGIAVIRPASSLHHIVPGQNVSTFIAGDVCRQPLGLRVGTYEDEQPTACILTNLTARPFEDLDRRKVVVPVDGMQLDPSRTDMFDFDRSCSIR